jgi:hypothetical protein
MAGGESAVSRSSITIAALSVALAATNLWWLYHAVDSAAAAADRETQCHNEHQALAQALAVLPVAARADSTPTEVVAAAAKAASRTDSFQKDGYTWVGELGFRFSDGGRLSAVEPAWQPF